MRKSLALLIALGLTACSIGSKTVNPGEYFTLKRGESARVKGTDIKLKMLENGVSQRQTGGDGIFCKAEISYKNKTEEKTLDVGGFVAYEEWNIRLDKVATGTDISRTTCDFVVVKVLG